VPRDSPPPEDMPWYRGYWLQLARENPETDFSFQSMFAPDGEERTNAVVDVLIAANVWPKRKATTPHEAQPHQRRRNNHADRRDDGPSAH